MNINTVRLEHVATDTDGRSVYMDDPGDMDSEWLGELTNIRFVLILHCD